MLSTQYPMTLCMMVTQLATPIDLKEIIPIAFGVTRSSQTTGLYLSIFLLSFYELPNVEQWLPIVSG